MGRDPRYGLHDCWNASATERDEFRCQVPGDERAPAPVPAYRVDMGPTSRAVLLNVCPVGASLQSMDVVRWLTAYGLIKRWQKWPPGRDDPRLMEALGVIQREHDAIDLERVEQPKR